MLIKVFFAADRSLIYPENGLGQLKKVPLLPKVPFLSVGLLFVDSVGYPTTCAH